MNPNKVDTVVREALQVYEQKEPRYLDVILKAYRAHIEREGATNTRFNIDFQSSPSIVTGCFVTARQRFGLSPAARRPTRNAAPW